MAGLALTSHAHPLSGRDGEALAMDVGLDGSPDTHKLLSLSVGSQMPPTRTLNRAHVQGAKCALIGQKTERVAGMCA